MKLKNKEIFFLKVWLITGWWHHHRAALCASRSSTLQSPGSSGSRWRCRSSCRLCGTQPSAGGLDATGYVAEAPLRRSSMSSYLGDGPHLPLHPHLLITARRGRDWCLFLFFSFFMRKNWRVCMCACAHERACVCLCVGVF